MPLFGTKRIKTRAQAERRINELHSTVVVPIDLLGVVPRGSLRQPGDLAKRDQAESEIKDLRKRFKITSTRPSKKG